MNPNVESHFSLLPKVNIERATFPLDREIKTSFSAGELIPFCCWEILPGDSFNVSTSKVIRSQTMLTPMFGDLFVDTAYFFVPSRLCWKHWQEFCGENTESAWAPEVEYAMPCISAPEGGFQVGTVADYMGLPIGVEWDATDALAPSALPLRAYALICNEFWRDENLTDPLLIPLDDAHQTGSNGDNYITDVANGGKPFKAAKLHSYFTSALPAPQRGSPVGIPITVPTFAGGVFPVTTTQNYTLPKEFYPQVMAFGDVQSMGWGELNSFTPIENSDSGLYRGGGNELIALPKSANSVYAASYGAPVNLVVDVPSQATGEPVSAEFTVNELRLAFAYQRFLEALARSGARYTELLKGLFSVSSPDARLQRPEYLGGNRTPIHITEVTNTAQTNTDYLGDVAAKSQTNDRNHSFNKSFVEHGYVIGVLCVRSHRTYSQGIEKFWTRKKFEDYYNPKFAHLGEMPIYQAELMATSDNMKTREEIFGYQEAFAEYRYSNSLCTGEMRPGVPNSLSHWNLADYYEEPPHLSDEWIRETPDNLDRVLAVSSEVANQFWADIFIQAKATRPMPLYSVPGLIDHF